MSATLTPVLEIDRVGAVEIGACWNAIRVTIPESADVISGVQTKTIRVFSQTVQVRVLREGCPEAKVLVLEDERGGRRVEEDFFIGLAGDFEAERTLYPGEIEFRVISGDTVGLWTRKDVVGDLVGGQGRVFDFDMKALCFVRVSIL
jgi:hypothetical protein